MNENEFDRTARAWLDEGPTEMSDRVIQAALDEVHATRQRLAWWPARRNLQMNNMLRAIVAAAVVVGVGVTAINVLPGRDGGNGSLPTSPPTAAPTPSAAPTGSAAPAAASSIPMINPGSLCTPDGCRVGKLAPGTYSFDAGKVTPRRLTFTVPAGWTIDKNGFVGKGHGNPTDEVAFVTWTVTHVYTDICNHDGALVSAGTTTGELAALLAAQKGRQASPVIDTTLGDFPAKRLELTIPHDFDVAGCDHGIVRFWPDPGPDVNGGLCCAAAGSTDQVYVVDVPGARFVVVARHNWDSIRADVAELEGIVRDIQIDDAGGASPSP